MGNFWFSLGNGVFDTTSVTSYSLASLSASMGYDFYVRSICSAGDTSYWQGPLTFNTLIQGPIGVSCTSGGNAGLIYLDDLESQGSWTGNFWNRNYYWSMECKQWKYWFIWNWSRCCS